MATTTSAADGAEQVGAAALRVLAGAQVRSKIWIEREGDVLLSEWRVSLLEQVQTLGSLSAAADAMGVPYRTAWQKLKELEEHLGVPLLASQSGGSEGGGSSLTPAARDLLARFQRIAEGIADLIDARFAAEFGAGAAGTPSPTSSASAPLP